MKSWLKQKISAWLNHEESGIGERVPMTDMDRLSEEVRQADVILVEGRTRLSEVIKVISNSPWTHAAIYIGRLDELKDSALQEKVAAHYRGDPREQLIIEALLGQGTVIYPLRKYTGFHLRICRPRGLSHADRHQVIAYAVNQLGYDYDVRHMLDLARYMLPVAFIPRRWRSVLFEKGDSEATRNVCSYMLAEAFTAVNYPILPIVERETDGSVKLFKRNTRLFAPRDFDYSPYFDTIKCPYFNFDDTAAYRALPWDADDAMLDATGQYRRPAGTTGPGGRK